MRRESTRHRIMNDYALHAEALSAEDAAAWQAALPELDAALDALPLRDRALLVARFYEDRSYREISRASGRTEGALMQQQHRALEKLSTQLRRRGGAVPAAALGTAAAGALVQAAPAGLAASVAASAPAAASSLSAGALLLHSLHTVMQTKARLTVAAGIAACLLAGSGAFFAAKSSAEAAGEDTSLAATAAPLPGLARPAPVSSAPPAAPAPTVAASLREKLKRAADGWRANTDAGKQARALEALDALAPGEVAEALHYLETLKPEYGLHLALAKRIARLWAAHEPVPALQWLTSALPREHRGEPMSGIVEDWSRRDPPATLAWWQGVMDSLEFPIPEDAFERLSEKIYAGWASHDPAGLVATLPAHEEIQHAAKSADPTWGNKIMGLTAASADPGARAAVLRAVADIPSEGTRAAATGMIATMMGATDLSAAQQCVLAMELSDPQQRGELLGEVAMSWVNMRAQSPAEAVAWLRTHAGDVAARTAVEKLIRDNPRADSDDLAGSLRAALNNP